MKQINHIVNRVLNFLEGPMIAVLFAIVTAVVFIQVVFRIAGPSLPWSEELARFLNTWTIFLGASLCVRNRKHLSVDILPYILKKHPAALRIQKIVVDVCSLIFLVFTAFWSFVQLQKLYQYPQVSPALRVNMLFCYLAVSVGLIMMSIRTVQKIVEDITGKDVTGGAGAPGGKGGAEDAAEGGAEQ